MTSKTVDIHGYSLDQAEDYLVGEILECNVKSYNSLEVIHGFNQGTALRDLIRFKLPRFNLNYFKSEKIQIKVEWFEKGRTMIHVKKFNN